MIKKFIVLVVLLGAFGYLSYNAALGYMSQQMTDQVKNEMLAGKEAGDILADPDMQALAEKYSSAMTPEQRENLPFTTKEEATRLLFSKFSMSELYDIANKASGGMSAEEQAEIQAVLESRLSDEEMEALMVIGLDEIRAGF
ncbi:hypothetical protein CR205_10875 [Alteribacter lacisalsi]|uniref:Uncharacterized protein n=1 Tax=Alteribacter lacisalsi TaxID=2045244 RepID=A0A2W0HN84_9BACI|nr:hypothetical protein [Alteribacter lacisalsi]PYZ99035.1 hypothetical protein CR205_10875 [Alteribacter lacisalsi]